MSLLEVSHLTKDFGGLRANDDISLNFDSGEVIGLIGPNGAGKTTLFNCITGHETLTSGSIHFNGEEISQLSAHEISRKGMARTFQIYTASGDLSVKENIMVGSFMHTSSRKKALLQADKVMQLLNLEQTADVLVSELPVAAQKRVTMATALATRPLLLLLDEVAAGLNPGEIEEILGHIRHIHEELGVTVMLIEHVMELVMKISQRVYVMDSGKIISEGSPEKVARDPKVIQAYLGERYAKENLPT